MGFPASNQGGSGIKLLIVFGSYYLMLTFQD